ncbi:hypothetical protein [Bacillus sp. EB600]|uniref:DUF7713 domain-containing protein n=1 Tax=Bacillus sp. EB600 TaxID=2806345 RepID=UPI00210D6787|nr:hypothetical protein [Bacillus sp. EB600]MCQ6282690.1 hypothetical protein [Bacillus sp. EB600]
MNKCEHCESNEAKVHFKIEATSMHLCTNCYNALMSEELEVDLVRLVDNFSLKDYQGISRTFHVERRLHPMGIFLEASENIEFGYKFAVHGELNCNQPELQSKLIEKVRKGIGEQQVETKAFPNGQAYKTILNDQIKGLIEYDETSDGTPLVIIDGKPFTWEEVGKMLMAYEGFQIKVKMYDITDDVE